MDAVEGAGEADLVFPLDSTNISSWDQDVRKHAEHIAEAFLNGKDLPNPKATSTMAAELLESLDEERYTNAQKRVPEIHHCDICDKILMSKGQWEDHLRSKRHKKALHAHTRTRGAKRFEKDASPYRDESSEVTRSPDYRLEPKESDS